MYDLHVFSPSLACLFILLMICLTEQNFNFDEVQYISFSSIDCALGLISKNSYFTFRSVIDFELIFV